MAEIPETVLAFDVGSRRIGVAVGQRFTGDGRRLAVVDNPSHARALDLLAPLLAQWRPQALLVGRPLTLDGGEQAASDLARGFARALRARFGLPVLEVDERHSSQEAARRFARARGEGRLRRGDADLLDADAAAVLIERFYDDPGAWLPAAPPPPA
ncbi:MAG: Holliday junction resolvase RuvX [Pseudoxanthomonas sp.]|nr:Holliday junction resolvase RuvX [Pseudoxanthomonas sp.]